MTVRVRINEGQTWIADGMTVNGVLVLDIRPKADAFGHHTKMAPVQRLEIELGDLGVAAG